jgi:hypothetical protein
MVKNGDFPDKNRDFLKKRSGDFLFISKRGDFPSTDHQNTAIHNQQHNGTRMGIYCGYNNDIIIGNVNISGIANNP